MSETDSTWYRRNDAVLQRDTLAGVLLLVPGQDEPVQITPPGDVVWELLAEPATVDGLVVTLADAYGAPAEVVRADVGELLTQLVGLGALIVGDD